MVRGAFTSRLDATPPQCPSGMRVALPALEMTAVEDHSGSMDRQDSSEDGTRAESPKREQSNVAIYVSIAANIAIAAPSSSRQA